MISQGTSVQAVWLFKAELCKLIQDGLHFHVNHGMIFLFYETGLVHKKLNRLEDALDCFQKLQAILRNHPQVLYQIANMYP